ncbi:magnesium transporter CorA family protein [Lacticaseibacillus jixiensis]|uniref:magnesium transporter CorA family protein n=1 Tax=Lacticaseibacillus jixiensis TaxID=3231926 RepID=UPI0036F2E038
MQTNYQLVEGRLTPAENNATWQRVVAPSDAEFTALDRANDLPFDYLAAGLDVHEEPRAVGVHAGATHPALIVLRVPTVTHNAQGDIVYETKPLALIVDAKHLLSIEQAPLPVVDAFIAHTPRVVDAQDLVLALIQVVLEAFQADVDAMDHQTKAMEARLATASRNTLLYEIIALERSLVYFDAALSKTQTLTDKLSASARFFTSPEHLYRLHALNVQCEQALTVAHCSRELLDQYNTAVSAIVGNNLNQIMKVLTSVSIIMTIPAIVAGIWGMNTWLPLNHGVWGFVSLLALIGVLCGVCAWLLKRKDYF